ncbi:MAG: M48 family metallopeptidase, partial [Thermoguttaceae bacterium]|nr:M48 family metallopeptidase [Thermoguttaceae bacterium]
MKTGTTMDFFERQDQARGRTKLLVFLFAGAVFLTFAATLALVAWFMTLGTETAEGTTTEGTFLRYFFDPSLIAGVGLCVLLLIGGGSLFKVGELKRLGADGVATALGGTRISRSSSVWAERRFYNVVEEMAIASGVPVPSVYVLRGEDGINACAIGGDAESSAIAVTDGALRRLSRDELQGVVAHEFGHLLNGDVKINMRLIGVLFGLQMLTLLGIGIYRSTLYASLVTSDSEGRKGGMAIVLAIWLFALGLIVIGSIGVFFSSLIRAAISRQREFLADASAAQFTRNPAGLAGALKKIGAATNGSTVTSARSAEMAHLFFGSVFSGGLSSLFQSHPNLVERIRRLEPEFDGNFERYRGALSNEEAQACGKTGAEPKVASFLCGTVFEAGAQARVDEAKLAVTASSLIESIGTQAAEKLD